MDVTRTDRSRIHATTTQVSLRLLETTDLHLAVMPYDYLSDRPAPGTGLAALGGLIRARRAEADTCLLLDNGDSLQGNPLSDWIARDGRLPADDVHPMIAAMNALGYDAATLGNHDFTYGLPFLRDSLGGADFPVVLCNADVVTGPPAGRLAVAGPTCPVTVAPPWAILDRTVTDNTGRQSLLRIGVIGFVPPQTAMWERLAVGGALQTTDIVAAAERHVPDLRQAGADIVVALGHTGIGPERHEPGMENAAVPLAAVDGIDVVLAGHVHALFPDPGRAASAIVDPVAGTLHGKPAVMAGCNGSHLGIVDLILDRRDDGTGWCIVAHRSSVERPDGSRAIAQAKAVSGRRGTVRRTPDAAVMASVRSAHDSVLDTLRAPVGTTAAPLDTYFAQVGRSAALTVLADALIAHGQRALQGTAWAALPLVAAVAPSRSGGIGGPGNYVDIPGGPLLRRHLSELYLYPNTVCALLVDGTQIRSWLERSAQAFLGIVPGGQDQPLLDDTVPGYVYDVLYGLRYDIDPSRPASTPTDPHGGARITNLRRADGPPVGPDDRFVVLTNSHRASGGGGHLAGQGTPIVHEDRAALQDVLLSHARRGLLQPDPTPVWDFAPLPGTTALFESGPGGIARLAAGGPHLSDANRLRAGFRSYRVTF